MDATMARVFPLFGTDTDALVRRWKNHPVMQGLTSTEERRKMAQFLDCNFRQGAILAEFEARNNAEISVWDAEHMKTRFGRFELWVMYHIRVPIQVQLDFFELRLDDVLDTLVGFFRKLFHK